MIEVPPQRLSEETLDAIIDEFVAREGTDYGSSEVGFETKTGQVKQQIEKGDVVICFDLKTESCTLLTRRDFEKLAATEQEIIP